EQHKDFIDAFFSRTGSQFDRFNYLGEWHSHPSFPAYPSPTDLSQMQFIVEDGSEAPLFAVLMVVRLRAPKELEINSVAFRPRNAPTSVQIEVISRPINDPSWLPQRQSW